MLSKTCQIIQHTMFSLVPLEASRIQQLWKSFVSQRKWRTLTTVLSCLLLLLLLVVEVVVVVVLCSYYIIFRANQGKKNFNPFSLLLAVFYALNYQNKNINSIPWDQFSNARALSVSIQKTCEQTPKEILQKWVQILIKFSGYYMNSFWSTSAVNTALVIAHAQQKLLFDVSNNG